MKIKSADLLRLAGLAARTESPAGKKDPLLLTGASTDPETGLIASLASHTEFNKSGDPSDIKIKYWRQIPNGESLNQNLITIKTKPARGKGNVEIDQIKVQAGCVYDSSVDDPDEPETRKRINRVLEGVNRLNTHLRNKGPIEDTAKILNECYFDEVVGENLIIRGLKKEGGFQFTLSPLFGRESSQGEGLALKHLDANMLKTVLGFSINTLEPDKDFSQSRTVPATDPQSGVVYDAGVELKESKNGDIAMRMFIDPKNVPDDEVDAKAIPDFVDLELKKQKDGSYKFSRAKLLGQAVDPSDTKTLLSMIGVAQKSNAPLAKWTYPSFMDNVAEYDMLDMVDPLAPPPSLEKGGEFLYVSLHGSGFEKKIENFGDQIGIADLFLHRGTKPDGTVSTVGLAVDFPFASGGADSNYDGAVPDYLPFWDDIQAFKITHDHFDHADGLPFYAKAGLMKGKDVYCTEEVKWALKNKMDFLKVPPRLRPRITIVDDDNPVCLKDEDGVERIWAQGCTNGAYHSARCTPYIVTGCYGDEHYNGTFNVYGDSSGLTEKGKEFFETGYMALAEQDGVTAEKLEHGFRVTLHDPTAVRQEGRASTMEQTQPNLEQVFGWFDDKGIIATPISTNDAEYTALTNTAHLTGRDITAVGRNAELRTACKNLYGMLHDFNLREFKLDPFEERKKPDPLIPREILDIYFEFVEGFDVDDINFKVREEDIQEILRDMNFDENDQDSYDEAYEQAKNQAEGEAYDKALQRKYDRARQKAADAYKEELDPSEREHEKNVRLYMLNSLFKHGAVVFEDDYNDYLMYMAIMDRQETASIRATRTSQLAKDFRIDPGRLMIFSTGTQGNAEERFSTLQKFSDFFSLLDVDESVRNTGYKINAEDFVAIITQPAIPGNDEGQDDLVNKLVSNRDITVVCAFMNGFKVYNPKDKKAAILKDLKKKGWEHKEDAEGNIRVYGKPIHVHGHGFREDLLDIAKSIPSERHECHHVPDHDSYTIFRGLMKDNGLTHSGVKPDDFQVFRLNAHADKDEDKYKKVAQLNPSYVLVKLHRKYGQFFGGWLQLIRTTMLRREGDHRADGLMARTTGDGVYQKKTARRHWEDVSNPDKFKPGQRTRKIGPSKVARGVGRENRSRSTWSTTPPEFKPEVA